MDPVLVPGTLDSLSAIARYVLAAAREAGLDRRTAYRLRLAVDEIATNVVTHGYQEAGLVGDVLLRAELDERTLTITLEDTAGPYDPRDQARPVQIDLPPEERPIGGLGVFLALESVDALRHEYAQGRNRNVLVVRRPTT